MKPFRGTSDEFRASIAVDASTIGRVTVATAVYATRYGEVTVLDSVVDGARSSDVRFVPFKSKSRHFDAEQDRDFFECVIGRNERRLHSLYFRHHSASQNQHYVEAVLTAILAHSVLQAVERPTFVLVDGDQQKADDFARAFEGFGGTPPTTGNCYQSALYYPHALLADLAAGYLANRVETGKYDHIDPVLRTSPADSKRSDAWGKAFDHLQTKPTSDYPRLGAESAYAETEKGRAKVWFSGKMGESPENASPSIPITTVTRYLERRGHVVVANRLREL